MILDPFPAVKRLRFPMAACSCLSEWVRMPYAESERYGWHWWTWQHTFSCRFRILVKFLSVYTSRPIHHLPSSQEGGRRECSVCELWGWVINQTASTQPPYTLTRQGIYIPLHTCQEIAQQWIITPDQVLQRGEGAGSDRDNHGKLSAPFPLSLMKTNSLLWRLY